MAVCARMHAHAYVHAFADVKPAQAWGRAHAPACEAAVPAHKEGEDKRQGEAN